MRRERKHNNFEDGSGQVRFDRVEDVVLGSEAIFRSLNRSILSDIPKKAIISHLRA